MAFRFRPDVDERKPHLLRHERPQRDASCRYASDAGRFAKLLLHLRRAHLPQVGPHLWMAEGLAVVAIDRRLPATRPRIGPIWTELDRFDSEQEFGNFALAFHVGRMTARMYEVYILNRPVQFKESTEIPVPGLHLHEPDAITLTELPKLLRERPDIPQITLTSADVEQLWIQFCLGYDEVLAAGCVVENRKGHVLWMERNGRWDLPKGKVEPGEAIEAAALREVNEETGIRDLTLGELLGPTYHTFEMGGRASLKTTFWFRALHEGDETAGAPQTEEGISIVRWFPRPLPDFLLSSTYSSLHKILDRAEQASEGMLDDF
jgi:8-oxo-dGTP pyrophosphatase MutT (NUDIX family)